MAVYVDRLWYHGFCHKGTSTPTCHLTADTLEELKSFATKIGLPPEWIHNSKSRPHFDLTAYWRKKAVNLGAKER